LEEAMKSSEENGMERPGILKIGEKYFLKSFNLAIDIKETCLLSVVALLLALIYTLNCKYPNYLTTFFVFLEYVFKIPPLASLLQQKKCLGK
jgi:hypothetical protein